VKQFIVLVLAAFTPLLGFAETTDENKEGDAQVVIDDFNQDSISRWKFVSDQVMGGVSTGDVDFVSDGDDVVAHMIGSVSTENNGGFIQFRRTISLPDALTGLKLRVRGNNQRYFVHIRTGGTVLPWQYYSAEFFASKNWEDIFLPFKDFSRSSRWLNRTLEPSMVRSLGIVAYGRDHQADIQVSKLEGY
jgi:hypothetical protein